MSFIFPYIKKIFIFFFILFSTLKNSLSFNDAAVAWQLTFQAPATPIMEGIVNFHNHIMFFVVGIAVFVG